MKHIPVLLNETIEGLNINPNGIYVDATLGRGGHSSEVLKSLKRGQGHLYCFDQDEDAIIESRERLESISKDQFTIIHDNFENLESRLKELDVESIDGIMFDLGVSSAQFDDGNRGFSYRYDAKLDMRMNKDTQLTAEIVVNTYSLQNLAKILKEYGEEPFAYSIAKEIVKQRQIKPISTTFELVEVIKKALPSKVLNKKGHPAKLTFQAIRIEVNNELGVLKKGLKDACNLLKPNGRVAVITFHSLEDRIVKKTYEDLEGKCICPKELPMCVCNRVSFGKIITKKPIESNENELKINPRARSAKLRVFERI